MRARRLLALTLLTATRVASGADCNSNGIVDIEEIRSGALPDCNGNDVPDGCDILPVNYGFVPGGEFRSSFHPFLHIVQDLDGDGDPDIVGGHPESTNLLVFWNIVRGVFEPAAWSGRMTPRTIIAADIDGDRRREIAVGGDPGLSILFHDSEIIFPTLSIDEPIRALASGDLDGDSDIDLAAAIPLGVQVLLNEGSSRFSVLAPIRLGSDPTEIIAARLDGDGDLDLATTSAAPAPGNVSILLNQGDGVFEAARNFASGEAPFALNTGDFDGNGQADLATASKTTGTITILFGDGNGRFTREAELASENALSALISADLDADGDMDMVSAEHVGSNPAGLSVFFNQGSAQFARLRFADVLSTLWTAADIDVDGRLDLVGTTSSTVTFLEVSRVAYSADCNSNLQPDECEANDCNRNETPDECDIASLASVDCNRDGIPDECQADCNRNGIDDGCDIDSGVSADCNRNDLPDECDLPGAGLRFETAFLPVFFVPPVLSSSDIDGDGRDDLFAPGPEGLEFFWSLETNGLFHTRLQAAGILDAATGDIDGDGDRDILIARGGGISFFENQGGKSMRGTPRELSPVPGHRISTSDLDGDLDGDIAIITPDGALAVLENDGAGMFEAPRMFGSASSGRSLAALDLDADGRTDLISDRAESVEILWNEGLLPFEASTSIRARASGPPAFGDVDNDGDCDLLLLAPGLQLFRNAGGRRFFDDPTLAVPGVLEVIPGDFDANGDQDLAVFLHPGQLAVAVNLGKGRFDGVIPLAGYFDPFSRPVSGDWNGDGMTDLAIIQSLSDLCPGCLEPSPPLPAHGFQLLTLKNVSLPASSKDRDRNGIPDECSRPTFHRADADGTGVLNVTDPVLTLQHLFQGLPAPPCLEAADANNDGKLDLTDAVFSLAFLFLGGPTPPEPGPPPMPCGLDTDPPDSAGDLGCEYFEGCPRI